MRKHMSGNSTMATFCPTVGRVLCTGWADGEAEDKALIAESRVVLPALSRPKRRIEYSGDALKGDG